MKDIKVVDENGNVFDTKEFSPDGDYQRIQLVHQYPWILHTEPAPHCEHGELWRTEDNLHEFITLHE